MSKRRRVTEWDLLGLEATEEPAPSLTSGDDSGVRGPQIEADTSSEEESSEASVGDGFSTEVGDRARATAQESRFSALAWDADCSTDVSDSTCALCGPRVFMYHHSVLGPPIPSHHSAPLHSPPLPSPPLHSTPLHPLHARGRSHVGLDKVNIEGAKACCISLSSTAGNDMLATSVAHKISLEYPLVPISIILGDAKQHGWFLMPKEHHRAGPEKSDRVAALERAEGPIQGGLVLEELALDALLTGLLFNRYLEELVNQMICSPSLGRDKVDQSSKLFLLQCPPSCSGKAFSQVCQGPSGTGGQCTCRDTGDPRGCSSKSGSTRGSTGVSAMGEGEGHRAGLLLSRGGRGGGGFGPKTWCTKNGLTRFSLL